jgi:hypothetical protein
MAGDGATVGEAGPDDDEDDGTYVHQPRSAQPTQANPADGEFGWHGWLLVGVIIFAFLVVPAALLYLPEAQSLVRSIGLTLRDAYLVLPLVPAFLLGGVAVWAAVKSRSD